MYRPWSSRGPWTKKKMLVVRGVCLPGSLNWWFGLASGGLKSQLLRHGEGSRGPNQKQTPTQLGVRWCFGGACPLNGVRYSAWGHQISVDSEIASEARPNRNLRRPFRAETDGSQLVPRLRSKRKSKTCDIPASSLCPSLLREHWLPKAAAGVQ